MKGDIIYNSHGQSVWHFDRTSIKTPINPYAIRRIRKKTGGLKWIRKI